jgi:hypothetical protein
LVPCAIAEAVEVFEKVLWERGSYARSERVLLLRGRLTAEGLEHQPSHAIVIRTWMRQEILRDSAEPSGT